MPPSCTEREPPGEPTAGHDVGVAVDHVDALHRHAEVVGHEHRPRRAVALPVRRGAGDDTHVDFIAIGCGRDLDLAELATALQRRDLDVDRHTDAELHRVAAAASRRLLGPQRRIVDSGEQLVEATVVVAAVVGGAGDGRERERDQDATRLRRRTSIGSMPISAANRSIARSMAAAASGRPAPR